MWAAEGIWVLVCDNCAGQNKNRMVLRYCVWLVESAKFDRVSLIFLVAGHTKNPCDRMFNLMKLEYHHKNIFDVDDLINSLGAHPLVDAQPAPDFKDYDAYFDKGYERPTGFKQFHCFEIVSSMEKKESLTTIQMRRSNLVALDTPDKILNVSKKTMPEPARKEWLTMRPSISQKPGLRTIKRVELSQKFAPLIPLEYRRRALYQPPSASVLIGIKETKRKHYNRSNVLQLYSYCE